MEPRILGNEQVYLGGQYLPLKGRIQIVKATQHAGKVTIGETSRADQVLADEWIQDDWRDGMLIRDMNESQHRARFWWSTANTKRRGKIMLPEKVYNLGQPNGVTAPIGYLCEYSGKVYASFGGKIHRLDADETWSAQLIDIGTDPFDHQVYKNKLYLSFGSYFYQFDGVAWTRVQDGGFDIPAAYFCTFDVNPSHKLMKITLGGLISASIDGLTWNVEVGGELNDATVTGMLGFRSPADEPMLVVATTTGLYSGDVWTQTTYKTSLDLLHNPDAGKGTVIWNDGALYFTDGLALWKYPKSGQIVNTGLDRDDGVPTFIRGRIIKALNTPNYLVAVVDASKIIGMEEQSLFLGMEWNSSIINEATRSGYSGIFAFNGMGWHTLHMAQESSVGIKSAMLSTAYNNERRLFFGHGNQLKYIVLPEGNYDPMEDPAAEFDEQATFLSSTFDANYSEIPKIALEMKVRCDMSLWASNSTYIVADYDVDGTGWQTLGVITKDTVDDRGIARFVFNAPEGEPFYEIKFRFSLVRDGTIDRETPCILFYDLRFKKLPLTLWGWTFTTQSTELVHLRELWETIKELAERRATMEFVFRSDNGEDERYVVEIVNCSGVRYAGVEQTASFTLTVVELVKNEDQFA